MSNKLSQYFTGCVVVAIAVWIAFLLLSPQVDKIELYNSKIIDISRPLVMEVEGLKLEAYRDGNDGWAIGYGHYGKKKPEPITEEQAKAFLESDLRIALDLVNSFVTVPLTDNQRAALVSFAFNVKRAEFISSTLVKSLNEGRYDAVPGELARWVYTTTSGNVKIESSGLDTRRKKEIALWLTL